MHVIQVGAGSGGMPVLDMVCQDKRVAKVTIIDPDVFQAHNVERHPFGHDAVGRRKVEVARHWLAQRRTDLKIETMPFDITDEKAQKDLEQAIAEADIGICAADNETAKFH